MMPPLPGDKQKKIILSLARFSLQLLPSVVSLKIELTLTGVKQTELFTKICLFNVALYISHWCDESVPSVSHEEQRQPADS